MSRRSIPGESQNGIVWRANRRMALKGMGGALLGLPFLESFAPRARAQALAEGDTFAIFFNQANGCAQAGNNEPERFFPRTLGALTNESMADRAVDELAAHKDKLLVLQNVNMEYFEYGDGHAWGALQTLTARPPTVLDVGPESEAAGESIDHRIGSELNEGGRESLFLHAGNGGGWLNGPCISYRSSGVRRTAINDPFLAYQTIVGTDGGLDPAVLAQLRARSQSVNDLVREQLSAILGHPRLSQLDRQRLDLHLTSVRDLEINLGCRLDADAEAAIEAGSGNYDRSNGDEVLAIVRLHMDVAALAVACGYTRSVAIQVGQSNDASTRYRNQDTGQLMENYHYISHRQLSHGSDGAAIAGADYLHHLVDRHFAGTFRHLLDKLSSYPGVAGGTLLDRGVCCWHNDNANGPGHDVKNVPWVLAGSCGGFLKQGQAIELVGGADENTHSRLLNTVASAAGVRKADGNYLDDFGDPTLPRGVLSDIIA